MYSYISRLFIKIFFSDIHIATQALLNLRNQRLEVHILMRAHWCLELRIRSQMKNIPISMLALCRKRKIPMSLLALS